MTRRRKQSALTMPKAEVKRVVLYARVSTKEQEEEGFSIPSQLKLLHEYADKNNMEVVDEFVEAETARKAGRKAFKRMVEFLKKEKRASRGARTAILVEKTDRIYRNIRDYVTIEDLEVELHLVKENEILSKDSRSSSRFTHEIKLVVAKNHVGNLSEETQKGMLEKAEQGIWPSFAPLGYRNTYDRKDKKRVIEHDPEYAPVVRKIFELYATGNFSLKALCNKAYEEGLVYRDSKNKIPKSSLHDMLTNPIYCGTFLWNGKEYNGVHEPIVSRELFDKVQQVLDGRSSCPTGRQKHDFAFQGILQCDYCGCAIVAEIQKSKYIYYHCTGNRGKCPVKRQIVLEVAGYSGM